MAASDDKHFRIKNGLKVGDTEVIKPDGTIDAELITNSSGVSLSSYQLTTSANLESLSASLGTYVDAASLYNLIVNVKQEASSLKLATLDHEFTASVARLGILQSQSSGNLILVDIEALEATADLRKQSASASKLSASSTKEAIEGIEASSTTAKQSISGLKLTACSAKLSTSAFKLSASSAKQAVDHSKSSAEVARLATIHNKSSALVARHTASGHKLTACTAKLSTSAFKLSASTAKQAVDHSKSSAQVAKQATLHNKSAANLARISASSFKQSAKESSSIANIYAGSSTTSQQTASGAVVSAASYAGQALVSASSASASKYTAETYSQSALTAKQSASGFKLSACGFKESALTYESTACAAKLTASSYAASSLTISQDASGYKLSACGFKNTALEHQSSACAAKLTASGYSSSALTIKDTTSGYKLSACGFKNTALTHQGSACAAKITASSYAASALIISETTSGYELSSSNYKDTTLSHQKSACAAKLTASSYAASALTIKDDASGYKLSACSSKGTALSHKSSACASKLTAASYAASALTIKDDASGTKLSACQIKGTVLEYKHTACTRKLSASSIAASALTIKDTTSGYKLSACGFKNTAISYRGSACSDKLSASGYAASALTISETASGYELEAFNHKQTTLTHRKTACGAKLVASGYAASALTIKEDASGYQLSACASKNTALSYESSACASKLTASSYAASALTIKDDASGYKLSACGFKNTTLSYRKSACGDKLTAEGYSASALTIKEDASGYRLSACSSKGTALTHRKSACASKLTASSYAASALVISETASGYKLSSCGFKTTALEQRKSACAAKLTASSYAASALTIAEDTSGYELAAFNSKQTALTYENSACASKLTAASYAASALTIKEDTSGYKLSASSFKNTALEHKESASGSKVAASSFTSSALTIKETISGYKLSSCSFKNTALSYQKSACAAKITADSYSQSALTIKETTSGFKLSACQLKGTTLQHKQSASGSKLAADSISGSALTIKQTTSGYKLSACGFKNTALSYESDACAAKLTANSYSQSALTIKETTSGYKLSACQLKGTTLEHKQSASGSKLTADSISGSALTIKQTTSGYKLSACGFKNTALSHQKSACAAKLTANSYSQSALTIKETTSGYKLSSCALKTTTLEHKHSASTSKVAASSITGSALQIKETISGYKLSSCSFKTTALEHQASACAAKLTANTYSQSALTIKETTSGFKLSACQLKGTTLEHKESASGTKVSASSITASALQIKETISGYRLSSCSFKNTSLSYQDDACAAKLTADSYSQSALTIKQTTSGHKLSACQLKNTTLAHMHSASSTKVTASSITGSALQIKQTISGYRLSSCSFKNTALSHQASACAAKITASGYSASALTIKEDASGYMATAENRKNTTLQHKQTASSTKVAASSITASALQIKETISGYRLSSCSFKNTALSHQSSACAAKITAEGYSSSALTIKEDASGYMATALTRKNTALTHRGSACAAKLTASSYAASALTIKNDAEDYKVSSCSFKNTALTYRGSACASKISASGYNSSSLTLADTASGFALSACASKGTALLYSQNASSSQLAAKNFEDEALEAKETASGYMITSQNLAGTALTFADTVSGKVVAINAHEQTASIAASQLGDLASNVQDIRALEASLITGANGHYTDNGWYIRDLVNSQVTALEDGGIILADEYRSNNVLTDPMARMDKGGSFPTSVDYYNDYTANSQTYTNDNQRVRVTRGSGSGVLIIQRDVAQTVQSGVSYTVTAEISGHNTAITSAKIGLGSNSYKNDSSAAFNYFSSTKTTEFPSGTNKFTITATGTPTASSAYINIQLLGNNLTTACIDNVTLHKTSETPWGYTKYQTLTVKDSTVAFEKYDIMDQLNAIDGYSGSNEGEKSHHYRIYSTAPIVVKSRAMLATPENFAGHILGFVRTRDHEQKVDLVSPFANATIKVYASRENDAVFKQGITSPIETIYLKQGEPYEWDTSATRDTWADMDPDSDNRINVVFASTARILGFVRSRASTNASYETDQTPLAILTNAETIHTGAGGAYKRPSYIVGGGINVEALRQAIKLMGEGQLVNQGTAASELNTILGTLKPGQSYPWGNIVNNNFSGWNDSSFTVLGDYVEGDSVEVSKTNYDRIDELINHIDTSYSTLKDCSFTRSAVTYNLYDAAPETNTTVTKVDGGPSQDVSIADPAEAQIAGSYFSASSFRTYFMTTAIGDGAGGDAQIGIPRASLSDYYVFPETALTNVQLVAVEPLSVQIMEKDGDVIATWETPVDVSESKPASFLFGDKDGGGPNLGNNAVGPFRIVGTAPFFCVCQNTSDDEHTMLGARQAQLSSRSQLSAVATQAISVKSQVNSLEATVTQEANSIDGLEAKYTVKIDNNNHISGFGLASTANDDASICSAFVVRADRFAIVSPTSVDNDLLTSPGAEIRPFEVDANTGQTIIQSAFIKELGSENIRGGSITGDSINATTRIEVFQTGPDGAVVDDSYAALDGTDTTYRFYIGHQNPVDAPFSVQKGGETRASRIRLYGPEGIYFDSTQGLGQLALAEIRDYLNRGLILSKAENITLNNLNVASAKHTLILTDDGSNLWQLIKYEVGQIASRFVTDYFGTDEYPAVVNFGDVSGNTNITKNYTNVTYPVSSYSNGVRTTTYVTGLTRAFRAGELIRLEWDEGTMASGATISTNAQLIERETQSALNGTSVGNGSSYSNHIVLEVVRNGLANMAVTITRANGATVKLLFSNYNSSRPLDNPLQNNTWPKYAVPTKIYLKPMARFGSATEFTPLYQTHYTANGFNAAGEYVLTGKYQDAWTEDDNDDPTVYRIRQRSTGFAYGTAYQSWEIESPEFGEQLGAVRADNTAHVWSSTLLHNLNKGVYEFKLDVELETTGHIAKTDFVNWQNEDVLGIKSNTLPTISTYESDVTLFDVISGTDATPPVPRVIIRKYKSTDETGARVDARVETGIRAYADAYGFGTEGNSFTQILHLSDIPDNSVDGLWGANNNYRSDSVIFLGGVSNESGFGPNTDLKDRDNLFVVALTEYDSTAAEMKWVKKLHLTADGRMYVGNDVTGTEAIDWQPSAGDRVATMDLAYPVGSIYMTHNASFDPNAASNHFYGTWVRIPGGSFLVNQDSGDASMNAAGDTGGSNETSLSVANIPAHDHVTNIRVESSAAVVSGFGATVTSGQTVDHLNKSRTTSSKTTQTGSGTAFDNRPKYYTVYMWRRSQ